MRITLRDGEKPFMAYQTVATVAAFFRFGGVAQDIGSPMLLRNTHADKKPEFLPNRHEMWIVAIAHQRR